MKIYYNTWSVTLTTELQHTETSDYADTQKKQRKKAQKEERRPPSLTKMADIMILASL